MPGSRCHSPDYLLALRTTVSIDDGFLLYLDVLDSIQLEVSAKVREIFRIGSKA
jgi:hypothetical protein